MLVKNDYSNQTNIPSSILGTTLVLALLHGLIDLASSFLLFSLNTSLNLNLSTFFGFAIAYDTIAFALQPLFGYFLDLIHQTRSITLISFFLAFLAILIGLSSPILSIILIGLSNALFHIAGGFLVLNLLPQSATLAGLFVAPGALGLTLGTLAGKQPHIWQLPIIILILSALIILSLIKLPSFTKIPLHKPPLTNPLPITFGLLLIIFFRAIIGTSLQFPWKSNLILLILLSTTIMTGKALGGWLADHFGWIKIPLLGLASSLPLLLLGTHFPLAGISGALLFQFTMPVTLVALATLYPNHKAFAFGLTTLTLVTGTILNLSLNLPQVFYSLNITLPVITSLILIPFSLLPLAQTLRSVNN